MEISIHILDLSRWCHNLVFQILAMVKSVRHLSYTFEAKLFDWDLELYLTPFIEDILLVHLLLCIRLCFIPEVPHLKLQTYRVLHQIPPS